MNPFPPPRGAFYPNMPRLPINHMPNMIPPGQFPPMPPIGMIPMPVGLPSSVQVSSMTIPTVPTGVTSISAPPVRKITPSIPIQNKPAPSYQMPHIVNKQQFVNQKSKYTGPIITVTVFVGNINEKVSDIVIRQILDKCGNVTNWKRVKGPNGKLQAFGYCDYAEADSALRALRLLHDLEIGDKKLLVKVDAKTREKLDQYAKENKSESNNAENKEEEKSKDEKALESIKNLLKDNETEIISKSTEEADESSKSMNLVSMNLQQNKNQIPAEPNLQNFSDMDIEDEKKTLIHREIGKFRSTYKKQDEENEKLEAERQRERELRRDRERERERNRRSSSRDRKLESSSAGRFERERERDREINRYDRSRMDRIERNERNERNEREVNSRSVYEDEETIEQRRQLREERRKEESYQKRLKEWESREERKKRQYDKEKYRLVEKKKEEEKELIKLKQFLEDYNDDLDDIKYYKGNNFLRKLREYEKEREDDERDRHLEKKELDELRKKLQEEGHPDPESEAKKLMSNVNKLSTNNKLQPTDQQQVNNGNHLNQQQNNEEIHVKSFTLTKQDNRQLNSFNKNTTNSNSIDLVDAQHITPISDFQINSLLTTNQQQSDKIKKKPILCVHDVFNSNEDDDKIETTKKRKLPVFIDDNTDSNQSSTSNLNSRVDKNSSNDSKSQGNSDDKRKQIKALIDNIPTTKEELFKYEIEWDYVDSNLMERRIRPWINKKITEYIGEEEKALLDFICGKLNARCNAQSILKDVAMVLDDEAEVFIVKMLRLLIYEIEAKKFGLGK